MALERPTLAEIKGRIDADIQSHLPGADTELRRGNLAVLGSVLAGAVHTVYGFVTRTALQVLPDTAEAEFLERHCGLWGIARKPAARAQGSVTVSGEVGAVLPAGAEFRRSDDRRYLADAAVTLTGTSAAVAVTAVESGADGDATAGSRLTLTSYALGFGTAATVAAGGITGGADQEEDPELLGRLIQRIQEPPHGGAGFDYEAWALEVEGVTRAWCYPNRMGLGTVGVTFLLDAKPDTPIPSETEVALVDAYIAARRPVTAEVFVFAPVAAPVNFDIRLSPDTEAIRAAVQAELADLFLREAEPEGGLYISHIREAVSIAVGEVDHVLLSPTEDQAAGAGELLTLGSFTWSD